VRVTANYNVRLLFDLCADLLEEAARASEALSERASLLRADIESRGASRPKGSSALCQSHPADRGIWRRF